MKKIEKGEGILYKEEEKRKQERKRKRKKERGNKRSKAETEGIERIRTLKRGRGLGIIRRGGELEE